MVVSIRTKASINVCEWFWSRFLLIIGGKGSFLLFLFNFFLINGISVLKRDHRLRVNLFQGFLQYIQQLVRLSE